MTILLNECPQNMTPTITATPVTLQQDSSTPGSQIATVSDAEDSLSILSVTINSGASATVNGVTVSNISVDSFGTVTADVVADCAASNATFTLRVTDSNGATE